jgi:predicted ArsR family transcriptional regulator
MDRLEAVGDQELRQALLYARSRPAAVTADELAEAQGVHRNVARARLERLVAAGLLEPGFERRSGRTGPGAGRPAKTYAVTAELSAVEFPQRRYERLIALLIESLPPDARAEQLHEVGIAFGREIAEAAALRPAKTLPVAAGNICSALGRIGYQAAVDEADGGEAHIHTPTCPLRPLVVAHADALHVDRGMWVGLAAAALDGVAVERIACESRDCLDDHASCRVRLRLDGG